MGYNLFMEKVKLVYKQLVGLAICISVFFLEINILVFGRVYNYFFPCSYPDDGPLRSAPCYLLVDAYVAGFVIILGLFLVVNILFKIFSKKRG